MKRLLTSFLSNVPLLAAVASLLWILDGVMRRGIGTNLPILTVVFYECIFGAIFVLPFTWRNLITEKPTFPELSLTGLLALITGPLAIGLFMFALLHPNSISFTDIYILQKTQGVFALLLIWIFTKRPIHPQFPRYAFLALLGAFLIIANQNLLTWNWTVASLIGGLAALGATAILGFSGLFTLASLKSNSHQFITVAHFIGGAIFAFLGVLLFVHQPLGAALHFPHLKDFWLVVGIGFIAATVSLIIYFKAIQNTALLMSNFLELLGPVFALVIDLTVYHRWPTVIELVGMITILIASHHMNRLHDFEELKESVNLMGDKA